MCGTISAWGIAPVPGVQEAFIPFPETLKLSVFLPCHPRMVSLPPQTPGQAVPPGTLCVLFQVGSSAWGALLKQCGRTVSLIWVVLPSFPCRQDSPNTEVCLQSACNTAGKVTSCFPDIDFLWLALFQASRHLLCSTAGLNVTRKLLYYIYIFY